MTFNLKQNLCTCLFLRQTFWEVMKAVLRGSKRPSEEGQAEPQENENGEPLKVKKPRGAAKAAAAKAAGKPATAVKAAAKKRNKPTGHGEASAASPADHGEVSAASPSDAKPDEDGGGDDGTKPLTVKEQWDLKDRVWLTLYSISFRKLDFVNAKQLLPWWNGGMSQNRGCPKLYKNFNN